MNRQDGPLLTGGKDDTTANTRPLLIRHSDGALVVTTGGGGPTSDVNLTEVGGAAIALGQTTMANSLPVVIASDQTAIPVTATFSPSGTQDVNLTKVAGASVATGHGTAAGALRVELPTDGTGVIATVGAVTAITNSVTVVQGTATSLKAQAEVYQGGTAVGAAAPLQVSLANTGANGTPVAVSLASAPSTSVTQGTSPWIVAGGGTAGTAATGVVTVQGIASGTNLPVSQATAASLNAQVVGSIAHDSVDSGNPLKVGNKTVAFGANPTAVASGDRTDAYANVAGVPFTLGGHPNVLTLRYNATAAETNTKLITVSGGTKIVMLSCTVAVDKACTVNVAARLGFAATNTPTTTGVYLSHPGIAPGSGIREAGAVPGADGDDFILTSTVPTTGSMDVVMKYFTITE